MSSKSYFFRKDTLADLSQSYIGNSHDILLFTPGDQLWESNTCLCLSSSVGRQSYTWHCLHIWPHYLENKEINYPLNNNVEKRRCIHECSQRNSIYRSIDNEKKCIRERKRTDLNSNRHFEKRVEPNRTRTGFSKVQSNRTGKVRFDSLSEMYI